MNKDVEELRSMRLSDMTLGEAYDRLKELQRAERRHVSRVSPPKQRSKVSEQMVGRYVMTVLASILCLLAFSALVLALWKDLGDGVKFAMFLVLGIVLEVLGTWCASKKSMRPFWLGVAGVGAGVMFIDLMAGSLLWGLYGLSLTCIFMLLWFAGNLRLGSMQSAVIFYVVAYIGGVIATSLSCSLLSGEVWSEVALLVMLGVMGLAGYLEYSVGLKQSVLLLHLSFCIVTVSYLATIWAEGNYTNLLPYFYFPYLLVCLYMTRQIDVLSGTVQVLIRAGFCFLLSLLLYVTTTHAVPDSFGRLLVVVLLCVFSYRSGDGYFLGVSYVFVGLLAVASKEVGFGILLAVAVLVGIVWASRMQWGWHNRLAMLVCYLMVMTESPYTPDPGALQYATALATYVLTLAFIAGYAWRSHKQDAWFRRPYDVLVLSVLPGLSSGLLTDVGLVPDSFVFALTLAGLYAYYFVCIRQGNDKGARFLWYTARGWAYLCLMLALIFPSVGDKVVLTLSMMMALGFNVYLMVKSHSSAQCVASCLLANWELACLSGLWAVHINILVSIVGIMIAAAFVTVGFILDIKPSRLVGLATAVAYALKLGIFDVSGVSSLGVAGGLLVAGLLCFGISFIYHKLGQKYLS